MNDEQRLKFFVPERWQNEPAQGLPKIQKLPKTLLPNLDPQPESQPETEP